MKNTIRYSLLIGFFVFLTIGSVWARQYERHNEAISRQVKVVPDKKTYRLDDTVRITVTNYLDTDICFESCNAFYLKKKTLWGWEDFYRYCEVMYIKECTKPQHSREFEIDIGHHVTSKSVLGTYVVAVPLYGNCSKEKEGFTGCDYMATVVSIPFRVVK